MRDQSIKLVKIMIIIIIFLILLQIFIEEYNYNNQLRQPPTTNSILVFSYKYSRSNLIYYFKKIIYFYFDI